MRERTFVVSRAGRDMTVFAAWPDGAGPLPAVILYMDIFGLRDELFDLARDYAQLGFVAVVHDMFHRRDISRFAPNNAEHARLDPAVVAAGAETTMDMALDDTRALVAALDGGALGVGITYCGAVGYCMGGRHALAAAARLPGRIRAGASVHGGKLVTDGPGSAHEMIAELTVPFWFAFATDDPTCPDAHQARIEEAAQAAGAPVTCTRFTAFHGWSFPHRWSHDPKASAAVRERTAAMFQSLQA